MMIETPQVAGFCQDRQSIDRTNTGDSCQQLVPALSLSISTARVSIRLRWDIRLLPSARTIRNIAMAPGSGVTGRVIECIEVA